MGRLILILFSLIDLLNGQALTQMSLGECCRDGQKHGHQKHDCSGLPVISELKVCRIAQEQCCLAVLQNLSCALGLHTAKEQGSCDRLALGPSCETEHAKVCCHCCLLGREALALGLGCDLNLTVAYGCGQVSHACCLEGLTDGVTNSTRAPTSENRLANDVEETQPNDKCRGAGKCSHRCLGNDTCGCFKGYKLKPDGHNCEDINECLLGAHHCRLGERCINTVGSYRCQREVSCGTGYELTDSNNCEDIDECEIGTHNCGVEFMCHNTQGSFRCQPRNVCELGFIQDALGNCIDMNECLIQRSPCQPGQTCVNTVGSFFCQRNSPSCGRGYHLNEEGTRCVDMDECLGTDNACAGHGCVNTVGSFRCDCHRGYVFNSISRTCEDINECRHYPGRLCAHKCDNILGSYQCSCTMGFKLASDGRNCEDMNECESSPCSQQCANVYGSYQCYCRRGYQLSDVDGTTCEDIDECSLRSGGHVCSHRCHNTDGSFYCSCPSPGYTLTPSGHSCQDVDECLTGTHNCSETERCFNIHGGFRCLSLECPANYRQVGDTRCERLACGVSNECLALPLRITHYSLTFPTHTPVPADIFRMGPSGSVPGDDVQIDIVDGNEDGFFGLQKLVSGGVVILRQPITEPRDFLLTVEMKLLRYGALSSYMARISIFVTHEPASPQHSESHL